MGAPGVTKDIFKHVLIDPESFSTTLTVVMLDIYGLEYLNWIPETILMESEQDLGIDWPQVNFDRLMAAKLLLTTDQFYNNLPSFIEICNIFSGSPASPDSFDPADASECAWGVTEALLLAPPTDNDDKPFTEEIRAYIAKVVDMEGIVVPPDILRLGIFSTNKKLKIHAEYSDDPEMFDSIWKVEKEKTDDINDLVKGRLKALITQLSKLPLRNGDVTEIAGKLLHNLSQS